MSENAEMKSEARPYKQTQRAISAAETERVLIDVSRQLLMDNWYDEVTLEAIAKASGVSVKTIQRRFGSKENLAQVGFMEFAAENSAWRDQVPAGDAAVAIAAIVEMYENIGDTIVRYLALETRIPFLAQMMPVGRELHRRWLERVFSPLMHSKNKEFTVRALAVMTDVYTWKQLRRDAGLSKAETEKTIAALVQTALSAEKGKP